MLLYHGLVGSSPENQRSFRDVRADVFEAIKHRSSLQLSIALRLPPLWWEDKLIAIFAELNKEDAAAAIALLAPDDGAGTLAANANPIKNDDWQVRANAASVLARLQPDQAVTTLGGMLADSSEGGQLASSHVAYALGKLKSQAAQGQLARYKGAQPAWLRVDIAGALALSEFAQVGQLLSGMLVNELEMPDYMSVAICKHHSPKSFFSPQTNWSKTGACLLVLGIIDAAEHSFSGALVFDAGVAETLNELTEKATEQREILLVAAAWRLVQWALNFQDSNRTRLVKDTELTAADLPTAEALLQLRQKLQSESIKKAVSRQLDELLPKQAISAELSYAIQLAGWLNLPDSRKALLPYLRMNFILRDAVIEAVGALGGENDADVLVNFAGNLLDVDVRNSTEKSKQPVVEADVEASKSYWAVLKALGGVATTSSAEFLLAATNDFAPDKRAQALESLARVLATKPEMALSRRVDDVFKQALLDPAPMMQLACVAAIARLNRASLISDLTQLIDANENSVSKDVFAALTKLSASGNELAVQGALKEKLGTTKDAFKRKRIEEFLATRVGR